MTCGGGAPKQRAGGESAERPGECSERHAGLPPGASTHTAPGAARTPTAADMRAAQRQLTSSLSAAPRKKSTIWYSLTAMEKRYTCSRLLILPCGVRTAHGATPHTGRQCVVRCQGGSQARCAGRAWRGPAPPGLPRPLAPAGCGALQLLLLHDPPPAAAAAKIQIQSQDPALNLGCLAHTPCRRQHPPASSTPTPRAAAERCFQGCARCCFPACFSSVRNT